MYTLQVLLEQEKVLVEALEVGAGIRVLSMPRYLVVRKIWHLAISEVARCRKIKDTVASKFLGNHGLSKWYDK